MVASLSHTAETETEFNTFAKHCRTSIIQELKSARSFHHPEKAPAPGIRKQVQISVFVCNCIELGFSIQFQL